MSGATHVCPAFIAFPSTIARRPAQVGVRRRPQALAAQLQRHWRQVVGCRASPRGRARSSPVNSGWSDGRRTKAAAASGRRGPPYARSRAQGRPSAAAPAPQPSQRQLRGLERHSVAGGDGPDRRHEGKLHRVVPRPRPSRRPAAAAPPRRGQAKTAAALPPGAARPNAGADAGHAAPHSPRRAPRRRRSPRRSDRRSPRPGPARRRGDARRAGRPEPVEQRPGVQDRQSAGAIVLSA